MINCIVAVDKGQGIGYKNSMPWPHLPGDMTWFKQQTMNNIVIMGRKTWESLGCKNLPNRINIVISRLPVQGCHQSFNSTEAALSYCKKLFAAKEIYVIGGGIIYEQFLPSIERFLITEIEEQYECDVFFDIEYVKNKFIKEKIISTFNDPIKYTIKEYSL